MKAIKNGIIILKDKLLHGKTILFNEKIIDITDTIPTDAEVIDAKGGYIGAGLIDIHIHGAGGYDAMDASETGLQVISETIAKSGVTSFLPTTMTMSQQTIEKALQCIQRARMNQTSGAKILGCHLEGPFISNTYKGAQNPLYIQKPTYEWLKRYKELIKIITLAPEEDQDFNFIKEMKRETSIVLSMGHTSTTFKEAKEAIELGISHATHTFNGMSPFNHRELGAVGAILTQDITAELIADKIHVNPQLFEWFYDVKGKERVILITDSMRAGGMPNGVYDLGGQEVVVENGSARLRSGSLAGSVLSLNQAVKNYWDETTLSLPNVYRLASLNPATVIGVNENKGSIEIGKDADLVIWNEELEAQFTILEGKVIYQR